MQNLFDQRWQELVYTPWGAKSCSTQSSLSLEAIVCLLTALHFESCSQQFSLTLAFVSESDSLNFPFVPIHLFLIPFAFLQTLPILCSPLPQSLYYKAKTFHFFVWLMYSPLLGYGQAYHLNSGEEQWVGEKLWWGEVRGSEEDRGRESSSFIPVTQQRGIPFTSLPFPS